METHTKMVVIPVTLKGPNYLLWSRLVKTALGGRGLWECIEEGKSSSETILGEDGKEVTVAAKRDGKKGQEDLMVLSIIQNSLDEPILEAYSYCETSKELWDTLQKVYGNISNISRVFEVKRAINTLTQEDTDFSKHFGKFRSLWAELEMLRPSSVDPEVLNERKEQDKVFALLFTLNPAYGGLIKHILRSDKLPSLEELCAQIQKEQGSVELFGGKGDLVLANKADGGEDQVEGAANRSYYKQGDKKVWECDHCKKKGHGRDKCWILHPHLKPQKFRNSQANYSGDVGEPSTPMRPRNAGDGKAPTYNGGTAVRGTQDESIKKSDLDALIKALKESGNTLGYTLNASYKLSSAPSALATNLNASSRIKPLVIDSGASHHMISDAKLIDNIKPILGNVKIANGDRIPIKGEGTIKLFDRDTKAFYMPTFASNLLSVKRVTTDLNCNVIFSPNEVVFQDIETLKLIGKGVTKEDLYLLEDITASPNLSAFSSIPVLDNDVLWHARLGHPHSRALNILLPHVSFKNDDCEACILGKHCKTVFPKSSTIYENCFDLIHSDVWTAPCLSRENHRYFVTFIDQKSKYTWLTMIQTKDRVLDAFINFQSYITNSFNVKIKVFRSDNDILVII